MTSTLVGTGTAGSTDGPAASATADNPRGIATAANGDVYWTDFYGSCLIRKWTASTDQVSTVAGTTCGYADGPITSAQLGSLGGLAVTPSGGELHKRKPLA